MARTIPDDRFDQLVACATQVFIEQGYRRTQMADIAAAMGIAKGTLYLYVESKEALFDLVCRFADTAPPIPRPKTLPVPTPKPGATLKYVAARLAENAAPAAITAALSRSRITDAAAELEAIVGELFDTLARHRRALKLLDRSARDYPELASLWFEGARGGLIALLTQYLDGRIAKGRLRPVPDTTAAARLVIETAAFWAMHRHWDRPPQTVGEDVARATVVRFIVGALTKE